MNVTGVGSNSGADALLQQSAVPKREAAEVERLARQERAAAPVETQTRQAPEQTKPVLNTQGQTTGTLVNTTA